MASCIGGRFEVVDLAILVVEQNAPLLYRKTLYTCHASQHALALCKEILLSWWFRCCRYTAIGARYIVAIIYRKHRNNIYGGERRSF